MVKLKIEVDILTSDEFCDTEKEFCQFIDGLPTCDVCTLFRGKDKEGTPLGSKMIDGQIYRIKCDECTKKTKKTPRKQSKPYVSTGVPYEEPFMINLGIEHGMLKDCY